MAEDKKQPRFRILQDGKKFRIIENESQLILRSLDSRGEAEQWVKDLVGK